MYYLSFDVANKSLAVSFINYDLDYKKKFNNIDKNNIIEYISNVNNILNNIVNYIYCDVIDLIPNKKIKDTTIQERTLSLKLALQNIKKIVTDYCDTDVMVIIEYQMCQNYNANAIYNQIIYEFIEDKYNIFIIRPSYKNKIYFSKELEYSQFICKYNNNYSANKAHTKANFLYFLDKYNMLDMIKNIKKKNIDDLADSFIQIFAYINYLSN